MLDPQFIRDNLEDVKKGIAAKQYDPAVVDEFIRLDGERKKILGLVEDLRAKRNEIAKGGKVSEEGKAIKEELKLKEPALVETEEAYREAIYQIPNLPAKDVPVGKDERENVVLREWGEPAKFDFKVRDHLELGEALGLIDIERAGKVSGTRFAYLKNDAVLLEFALIRFAFETLLKNDFVPIAPPALLKVDVFEKLGYSEHLGNENFYFVRGGDPEKSKNEEEEGYYLAGTAEHSIAPYYMDEVLAASELPRRFVGFSSSFRRESGSYGKDTRGIFRVHQFDKVEMFSFTKPEEGDKEHEFLLSLEENLFQALEIPYQVVKMCTGDLGAPAVRKYDIEAWFPSESKYREVTSTSTTTDFQARRLNIKFRDGDKSGYVHMLNGTAFAIGRTIAAILENYQQKDGSVKVPKVLVPYVGKQSVA